MRRSLFSRIETWLGRITWWQVLLGGVVLGLATGGLVWFTVVGYINIHDGPFNWRDLAGDFYGNLPAEIVFFLVTVFVIDRLNRGRQQQQLKEQLIRQMGSEDNVLALQAVREIRAHDWLKELRSAELRGANLQKAPLRSADLSMADLGEANLQGADLKWANLHDANLFEANLQDASLSATNLQKAALNYANLQDAMLLSANLQEASLHLANLQDAKLVGANLQGATLVGANLQEAWLFEANLQGADLSEANLRGALLATTETDAAEFDEETQLPDYTQWSPQTDMERFTDPEHLEFWEL